jgi:hypothetical protein
MLSFHSLYSLVLKIMNFPPVAEGDLVMFSIDRIYEALRPFQTQSLSKFKLFHLLPC